MLIKSQKDGRSPSTHTEEDRGGTVKKQLFRSSAHLQADPTEEAKERQVGLQSQVTSPNPEQRTQGQFRPSYKGRDRTGTGRARL